MLIEAQTINFKGKPLFQRTKFKTPLQVNGRMEDKACFFYTLEGTYETFDYRGGVRIGANEGLLRKCGNHVAHLKEGHNYDGVVAFLYPEMLHEIYEYKVPSFLENEPNLIAPGKMIGNELLEKFIQGLFNYFDNPGLMDEELALLKIKELVLILLKSKQHIDAKEFIAGIFSFDKLHFQSAIESNLFSDINLDELAFICNMSLSSFNRQFKRTFNDSPSKYIKNRRLEHAATLLKKLDEPISNIAFDCGFQDVTTFSDSFKKKYGIPPSKYRKTEIRKS